MRQVRRLGLVTLITCGVVAGAAASLLAGSASPAPRPKIAPAAAIFVPSGTPSANPTTQPVCRFLCYSPAQLRQAYDFPSGKDAPTGAGQTIVVATAFGSPTLESDLQAFDTMFGLPPATLSYCGAPNLGAPDPGLNNVWGPETSADVEYAHAMAPDAQIVLVVAPSDDFGDMADVQASCLPQYPGAILMQSFGEDETDAADPAVAAAFDSLHSTYVDVTRGGGTVLAASGDFGANGINCDPTPGPCGTVAEYPASDPIVTAVGGTEGNPYPDGLLQQLPPGGQPGGGDDQPGGGDQPGDNHGQDNGKDKQPKQPKPPKEKPSKEKPDKTKLKHDLNDAVQNAYGGEQVWNESDMFSLATGGAPSILFPTPDYQRGFNNSEWRTTSDVAYDAAVQGGEAVIFSGRLGVFAGTSIGPAHWAAIVALANELRASRHQDSIGQLNPALYDLARDPVSYKRDFHDITSGNNSDGGPGFDAGPGYDLPTGLGTPDVSNLISDLVRARSKHDDEGDGHRRADVEVSDKIRAAHHKLQAG